MDARPRLARIAWLAPFAALPLVVAVAAKTMGEPIRPEDLWWHLGMGRYIAAHHLVPSVDVFSFTRAGAPYYDQPWLAQLAMFAIHRAVGLAGLLAFDFVMMLFAECLVVAAALRRGARLVPALLIQLALVPMAVRGWPIRTQAFCVPLFAAFVYLLVRWRSGARAPLWLLPVLMVAWANLHGGFPLGIALVALALVAELADALRARRPARWKGLALAAAGCVLAPLANPRGPELWGYVASLTLNGSVRAFSREWQPITLADAEGKYIVAVLVVVVLLALYRRPALGDLLWLAPFALLQVSAVRNGIWLSLLLGPTVTAWLSPRAGDAPEERPTRRAIVVTGGAVALLLAVPWVKPRVLPRPYGPLAWEVRTPVAAVAALAREPRRPSRLFHSSAFGSYLIWALPSQRVFIDPRFELYPRAQWEALNAIGAGRDVDAFLARYRIDGLLLDKHREAGLVAAVSTRHGFALRYEDDDCAYFVRR